MTDQSTAHRGDYSHPADDDPLAELERIVSGSPKQAEAPPLVPAPSSQPGEAANGGSEIDIEAELMRELEGPASQADEIPEVQEAARELSLEEQLMAELSGEELAPSPRHGRPVTTPVAPPAAALPAEQSVEQPVEHPAAAVPQAEAEPDGFSADLAFADELERDLAAAGEADFDLAVQAAGTPSEATTDSDAELSLVEQVAAGIADDMAASGQVDGTSTVPQSDLEDFFGEGFADALEEATQSSAPRASADLESDFGDVFSAEVDQLMDSAEPSDEAREIDLEAGFADAFAEELAGPAAHEGATASAWAGGEALAGQAGPGNHVADGRLGDPGFGDPSLLETDTMNHAHLDDGLDGGIGENEEPQAQGGNKRGFRLAMGSLVMALVLGVGVIAWSSWRDGGTSQGGDPVVITASEEPAKVRPEEPGGKEIANQDNQVYDRVAGGATSEPTQETLVDSRQEPVDIAPAQPASPAIAGNSASDPSGDKAVSRLAPEDAGSESVAGPLGLTPKRVQTVTVKPDGTIVAAAAPAAPAASTSLQPPANLDANDGPVPIEPGSVSTGAIPLPVPSPLPARSPAAQAAPAPAPVAVAPAPAQPARPAQAAQPAQPAQASASDPGAPVQIAPTNTAVAAAAPAPAAQAPQVTSSEWKVQVSSQRTREDAETSFRNLRNRFTSVLGDRTAAIESADIEGRGRFYRVKVLAESQAEANQLCNRLKSAGGSCFVTR